MAENITNRTVFSLLEVTKSVKNTLEQRYSSSYWVKAEMNKLNLYPQSGHCYPELVEKQDGKVIAQMKAIIWKDHYTRINNMFVKTIREPLKDGIKILLLARINFDPIHGLTLTVLDIDPSFTLGDIERERRETIIALQQEGVYSNNRALKFPLLPQRIAVISDETSKGYADFKNVIDTNPWNYKIFYMLFPSLLQGERSVPSIIEQLKRIKQVRQHFDAVAIIRGGGGDIGLSSYNQYALCREIALFPIPIVTGIGHSTNDTVAELVAYSNQITPTKLADFILQCFHNYAVPVQKAQERITEQSRRIIRDANKDLTTNQRILIQQANNIVKTAKTNLSVTRQLMKKDVNAQLRTFAQVLGQQQAAIVSGTKQYLKSKQTGVESLERNLTNMSPEKVLRRGYSITLQNGKAITSADDIQVNDSIETVLFKGTLKSSVKTKSNE